MMTMMTMIIQDHPIIIVLTAIVTGLLFPVLTVIVTGPLFPVLMVNVAVQRNVAKTVNVAVAIINAPRAIAGKLIVIITIITFLKVWALVLAPAVAVIHSSTMMILDMTISRQSSYGLMIT